MSGYDDREFTDARVVELLDRLQDTPDRDPVLVERYRASFLTQLDATPLPWRRPTPWARAFSGLRALIAGQVQYDREDITVRSTKMRLAVAIVAVMVVGVIVLFGGSAVTVLSAQSAIPGDALYRVKTTVEQTRLSWTRDAAARADIQLEYAERRWEEIRELIDEGRFQNVEAAALAFEAHIARALDEVDAVAQSDPAQASRIVARANALLMRYVESLGPMLDSVPEPLQTDVRRTIEGWGAQGANENTNVNDNLNDNLNTNNNINANDNVNLNTNDNANTSVNDNLNDNANTNVNDNLNLNSNTSINDNADSNFNSNTNTAPDGNLNYNYNYNDNDNVNTSVGGNDNAAPPLPPPPPPPPSVNTNTNDSANDNGGWNNNVNTNDNRNENGD